MSKFSKLDSGHTDRPIRSKRLLKLPDVSDTTMKMVRRMLGDHDAIIHVLSKENPSFTISDIREVIRQLMKEDELN